MWGHSPQCGDTPQMLRNTFYGFIISLNSELIIICEVNIADKLGKK